VKKVAARKRPVNREPGGKWAKAVFALKAAAFVAPLVLFMGGFAYLSFARDAVPVREIVFYGNRNLSAAELTALLKVKEGENLFGMSSKGLSAKLLVSPWIKSAAVRREVLAGRLLVRLEEREPFALLRKDGALWIADEQGLLLERIDGGAPPLLPVIEADAARYRQTFDEAILLARLLRQKGFFDRQIAVVADVPPEALSMRLGDVVVRVGYGDYERKLEKLRELEGEIARRGIPAEAIDLRFANRVIVSPVKEVSE
jgi:cell division septal protein FtsQ